jgi:hypothetical protein
MSFHFMPAGLKFRAYSGMGAYIKYHARRASGFRVIEQTKNHIWVDTLDREIFITDQTLLAHAHYPTGFDEFVNLSHFHAKAGSELGLDYVMINYTDHMRWPDQAMRKTTALGNGTALVTDSGGFQIVKGDLDWIDPVKEIEWMNSNTDLAMLLDVPTQDPAYITRAAHVQKHVIDLWQGSKRPDLELINIVHGQGTGMRKYLDIVETDGIDRIAFGGMFWIGFMNSVHRIVSAILMTPDYKQHHVLGVTHRGIMMLLMYMSKLKMSPQITCDSSSALQLSCYRTLYLYNRIEESIFMKDMGEKGNYVTGYGKLPCNCPICSTLVYADTFRNLKGDIPDALVCMHNVYAMNDWVRHTDVMVQAEDKKTIKESMRLQFENGYGASFVKLMHAAMDYIDYAVEHGADKARKKYDMYFPSQKKLFSTGALGIPNPEGDDAPPEENVSHTEAVLQRYESYFGITP